MTKKYDVLVFIGRFQPLHYGHCTVIDKALELSEFVIVGVGSSNQARSDKNPFTFDERVEMIRAIYPTPRIIFVPLNDYRYDDLKWLANARQRLNFAIEQISNGWAHKTVDQNKIGLIGHEKDGTSYYLKMFPEWKSESVPNFNQINATDLRNHLLHGLWDQNYIRSVTPTSTIMNLMMYSNPQEAVLHTPFDNIVADVLMTEEYKKAWAVAPYPPTFVTADAVVTVSGHVLLVKRGASPGKGLSALPGGFINPNEMILDAALRELREETKLKVPPAVLKGSIVGQHVFDHPYRSSRGRTVTHAFHFDLGMQATLPKVKGSDDAEKAKWVPLNQVDPTRMFEDHYDIISHFTGIE